MIDPDPSDILPDSGATITLHRNNPGLPDATIRKLTSAGIGVVDFGMGANLDPDDSDEQAETRTKQTLLDISAGGAYGAIHTEEREQLIVGYASPRSLRLFELEDENGNERIFPTYQFERYGSVHDRDREVFGRLQTAISNRLQMPTLYQPDEGDELPGAETIPEAYFELDEIGALQRPSP